jgi:hypothetical protein
LQIGFDYQDRKTGEIKNRKLRLTMDRGASSDSIWLYRSVCENIQVKKLTSASFIPR